MSFGSQPTAEHVAAGHDLHGRNVIVTGGTSGLGEETARALAGAGATVVVTGRDPAKGQAAAARLRQPSGHPAIKFEVLDLGSLASVNAFADLFLATGRPLHLLFTLIGLKVLGVLQWPWWLILLPVWGSLGWTTPAGFRIRWLRGAAGRCRARGGVLR
ncbi:MAG: SDR family NAD(P)-dependent oxidoreductase [Micromonosporaceae bacterium]